MTPKNKQASGPQIKRIARMACARRMLYSCFICFFLLLQFVFLGAFVSQFNGSLSGDF